MNTSKLLIVCVVMLAVLLAGQLVMMVKYRGLAKRQDALQILVKKLGSRKTDTSSDKAMTRLRAETTALRQAIVSQAGSTHASDGGSKNSALDALQERLREIDYLTERIDSVEDDLDRAYDKKSEIGEDSKMPFDRIAAETDLNESQQENLFQKTLEYKQDTLELMSRQTPEGPPVIEQLFDIILDGKTPSSEKKQAIIGLLGGAKIADTDETYLERIIRMNKDLKQDYQDEMTPEQWKRFLSLGVKPDNVEIPDDPGAKAFIDYLARRK
ncbi:MAG: hypothetical protein GY854_24555 [Deltaproteobacteria bacterium]|nr:hypothetical protein [Deltaproteobacteria bacterium]